LTQIPDEVTLLLALAKVEPSAADVEKATRIVRSKPDWDYLLCQASRHRVLPLVARNMYRLGLYQLDSYLYANFDTAIGSYHHHQARNRSLRSEFAELIGPLMAEVPRIVVRKGMYLAHVVYQDPGVRPMMDLDLLVEREHATEAVKVLEELGYASGTPTANLRRVTPLPRDQQMYWRLYVNNLPPYFRPTSDPLVNLFAVDFSVGLFLSPQQWAASTTEVIDRAQPIDIQGCAALGQAPEDLVLDLCAHLYKESTTLRYMHRLKFQRLIQYCDLRETLTCFADVFDWGRFLTTCDKYEASSTVHFALAHLELLFPGTVPEHVRTATRPLDRPDFLDQFAADELAEPLLWHEPFMVRMFSPERTLNAPASTLPI
jgi:hypothetical protein